MAEPVGLGSPCGQEGLPDPVSLPGWSPQLPAMPSDTGRRDTEGGLE